LTCVVLAVALAVSAVLFVAGSCFGWVLGQAMGLVL
jgi:hypothetical protein